MATKNAKVVQMTNGMFAGAGEIRSGVARRRRNMKRDAGVVIACKLRSSNNKFVTHQIMSNECDPTVNERSVLGEAHDFTLTVEYFADGSGKRTIFDIPTPTTKRSTSTHCKLGL